MTPEEVIQNIEATNNLADQLDALKTNLEGRGWSSPAAEQASIAMTHMLIAATVAKPRGFF